MNHALLYQEKDALAARRRAIQSGSIGSPSTIRKAIATARPRWGFMAFTLIELLVVISIIGVLASLTVGLTKLATRKSNEARIKTEMSRIIGEIENYKSSLGFYPPDHSITDPANAAQRIGVPAPNPLYYELSGMVFNGVTYSIPGRSETLSSSTPQTYFGNSGFANAAKDQRDLKFTTNFKASQYHRIDAPPIDVLSVPVKGPDNRTLVNGSIRVNPWLYVSTSPTNNPERFDLWTEVIIGNKIIRFSNWEKDPVVLP